LVSPSFFAKKLISPHSPAAVSIPLLGGVEHKDISPLSFLFSFSFCVRRSRRVVRLLFSSFWGAFCVFLDKVVFFLPEGVKGTVFPPSPFFSAVHGLLSPHSVQGPPFSFSPSMVVKRRTFPPCAHSTASENEMPLFSLRESFFPSIEELTHGLTASCPPRSTPPPFFLKGLRTRAFSPFPLFPFALVRTRFLSSFSVAEEGTPPVFFFPPPFFLVEKKR